MVGRNGAWVRQGEAFWRAHHEAWKRSDLNQRQYCEAEGIPLKAFGNWRAIFKAEPQPPERKLLWRRRGLSPPFSPQLSPPFSPPLNPRAYPSCRSASPIVARPREGHRRRFSEADNGLQQTEFSQDDVRHFSGSKERHVAQKLNPLCACEHAVVLLTPFKSAESWLHHCPC